MESSATQRTDGALTAVVGLRPASAPEDRREAGAPGPSEAGPAALELRRVSKRFGQVVAVRDVSFSLGHGEVVALLGDNGAGKSTVVKMISGVFAPTSGEIRLDGQAVRFRNSKQARERGIATVYQDLALVPTMNVWRNFFLGSELRHRGRLDVKRMRAETAQALHEIGLRNLSSVDQEVKGLSGGERQALSIGRAVHFQQQVLLLDEPTAALSVKETEKVFDYVRQARQSGIGILLIMHNTVQALSVSDRVVVMRHGEVAAEFAVGGDLEALAKQVNLAISGAA
ncbi:ATP-binding cassette domain-containing protein [Aciditerrimonas ferrireducens]|jgi:simple sugar transport system ATP-binding protein|uniref:ATP-binding cassette domain-containing protein n=1 Tax=Aciditerrimonas ferrireducens TaxID=667306 RepID=A0ABV6C4Q7_9ACTN